MLSPQHQSPQHQSSCPLSLFVPAHPATKTEVVRLLPECWITMLVKSDSVLLHTYNSPVFSSAQKP